MFVRIGQLCLVLGLIFNPVPMVHALDAAEGTATSDLNARARAEVLFAQGFLSWADADSEAAQEKFLEAAGAWPHDTTYAFFAGHMASRRNRSEQAASLFASALPPAFSRVEEWRVYFEFGRVQYLNGELPEAEGLLRQALELNPEDAGALFYLGFVMLDQDRPEDAIPLFSAGRANAPELTADSRFYTGVAAMRLGDRERARSEFQRVLESGTRRVRHSIPEIMAITRDYLALLDGPAPAVSSTGTEEDLH